MNSSQNVLLKKRKLEKIRVRLPYLFPMNRKQALVKDLGNFKGLIIKVLRKVKIFYMPFGVLDFFMYDD